MSGGDAISLPNVMVIEYASASRSKRNIYKWLEAQ